MKVEIDMSRGKIAMVLIIGIIGLVIGYGLGLATAPSVGLGTGGGIGYLSSADLNREDIQASILLSRFCEGLGLQSSVYWQQDAEGNVFGTPICLAPQQ